MYFLSLDSFVEDDSTPCSKTPQLLVNSADVINAADSLCSLNGLENEHSTHFVDVGSVKETPQKKIVQTPLGDHSNSAGDPPGKEKHSMKIGRSRKRRRSRLCMPHRRRRPQNALSSDQNVQTNETCVSDFHENIEAYDPDILAVIDSEEPLRKQFCPNLSPQQQCAFSNGLVPSKCDWYLYWISSVIYLKSLWRN